MYRRDFIKHSSAAAAAVAVAGTGGLASAATAESAADVAAPAIVPEGRALKLVMPWTQNGRGFDDSAARLANWVRSASNGRYRVTIAGATRTFDDFARGDGDLFHGGGHDFSGLDPAFAYFAGLPGTSGLRPTYFNAWLVAAGGQMLWDDLAAGHGFKPLFVGHSGARAKLWSREAIGDLADLQGRRIAAYGLAAQVVRRLGADVVDVAMADAGAALADGRVDAVEFGGTIAGFACGLHEGARFCLRPGLSRNGFSSVLAVRAGLWHDMPETDRALFSAGAALELNTSVAETLSVSSALRMGLSEQGVAFQALSPAVADAAAKAANQVVADLAASSPAASRIHASYSAFRAGLPGVRRRPLPLA